MCLFGDFISALTLFFALLAVVGRFKYKHAQNYCFLVFVFDFVIAEMLKVVQVREQMGMD